MKMKCLLQRAAAALLSLLLCVCCLPRAYALAPIEDRSCSLTVDFAYPGVPFRLYRVGDLSPEGRFSPAGDFADYPVSFRGLDSAGWRAMAETLAGYADRDGLTPLAQGEIGESGTLLFSDLRTGLYLGVGQRTGVSTVGDDGRETTTYVTPEPFLVSLPHWQEEDSWLYDVTVTPKFELSQEDSVMRRVLKVWDDAGYTDRRPSQIRVDLLRDGEVYDTVTLSAENNWRYVWENLDNRYQWRVSERSLSGYRVSVSLRGVTFVITNTYTPPPPDNPPPDNPPPENPPPENPPPENPPPEEPPTEIPDNPPPLADVEPEPPEDEDPVTLEDPEVPLADLPQTGQLWWPVPLLAMGGMFLFLLGWVRRRNAAYEN